MREWVRASRRTICGLCGEHIPKDTPYLLIRLRNVKRERIRCAACIGEAVPEDVPPLYTRSVEATTPKVVPFARLTDLARDWKMKQSGG